MITFQREYLREVVDEARELLKAHWHEIGEYDREKMPMNPAWDQYLKMAELGLYIVYTAREDGELVGYITFFNVPLFHYMPHQIAENDVTFIYPEYRRGMTGYRLIKFAITDLKQYFKVAAISLRMKQKHNFGRIAERLGFKLRDLAYFMEV